MSGADPGRADRPLAAAAALAGAAALAYELLWTRLLALALGHEQLGVLSVLAGFFAGVALGAWLSHRRADDLHHPARVFALLQLVAAIHAVMSAWLLPRITAALAVWLGLTPSPLTGVLLAALLLLPATCALGASLPVLVAARRRVADDDARGLARLYALDTMGATLGVWLTIHVLLPRLGVATTSIVAGALGLAAAGMALRVDTRVQPGRPARPVALGREDPDDGLLRERWLLLITIGLTGVLGLGLEVVGVRVLAQIFTGTIYSFAALLAVWLLGTGIGAGVYARLSARALGRRPATVLIALLLALAMSVALASVVAASAPDLLARLGPIDASWTRRQLGEWLTAALVLGPPTLLMGACLAHLLALIAEPEPEQEQARARPIGGALAINAGAAATAPFLFGLWALDALTYAEVWALIAWGYLLVALAIAWLRRFPPTQLGTAAVLGSLVIVGSGALAPSLVLVDEADGWTLVERREAPLGVVAVSHTTLQPGSPTFPLLRLQVDRHYRMGGALSIGERRMGHLSLLWRGASEGDRALFLGLGTGATAGAGMAWPLGELIGVELIPEVLDMLGHFEAINGGLANGAHVQLYAADARRFVQADARRHDLIVADLFHPARDGAGSLYAREHFEAIRDHLEHNGVFVQWLPLHQLDWTCLRVIVRTYIEVFPEAHAILALYNAETPALGLVGGVEPITLELAAIEGALAEPSRAGTFAELALLDSRDFLAGYMLDRAGLIELAGDAPINDDLHPRIDLWAPKIPASALHGADNLDALLALRRAWPDTLVTDPDAAKLARWRAASLRFGEALEHYLRGEILRARRIAAGAAPLEREVLEHYLAAWLREPEFLPARGRLRAAAEADPEQAAWLLPAMRAVP